MANLERMAGVLVNAVFQILTEESPVGGIDRTAAERPPDLLAAEIWTTVDPAAISSA